MICSNAADVRSEYYISGGNLFQATRKTLDTMESGPDDVDTLRRSELKLKKIILDMSRNEARLALKLAHAQRRRAYAPKKVEETSHLVLDPVVALEVQKLREQLQDAKAREDSLRGQVEASNFQQGSEEGKKLVQKCKDLQTENEQLGKEVREGIVEKLRIENSMHKEFVNELQNQLGETREWVEQLLEELEVSQSLIFSLRRELSERKRGRSDSR